MGRLVRIPGYQPAPDTAFANLEGVLPTAMVPRPAPPPPDDYLTRVAKYVPAEVLGFSLFINAMLEQAIRAGGPDAAMAGIPVTLIAALALLGGLIATPLFVWNVRQDGDAWVMHALVSTCLFPVWAYVIGAVAFGAMRDGNLAAILVISATAASGFVSPAAQKPHARLARMGERPQLVEVTGAKASA